jgi:membrane-bound ClpP family serine protease
MVGLEGIAEETFSQEGMVFVRGELWKATAERGIIQKGEKILVSEVMPGLKLLVRSGKDPAEA